MTMDYKKIATRFLPVIIQATIVLIMVICFFGTQRKIDSSLDKALKEVKRIACAQSDLKKEMVYVKRASRIIDYYYKEKIYIRFYTVKTLLKAIDLYTPTYFPGGPFTKRDFIALALTETADLNQYSVGSYGEYGIFQIMPEMMRHKKVKKNHFNIYVNTETAMWVMREKYKKHKDYYKAIIAYNGVVINKKTKRWRDRYWKLFLNHRKDVEIILGGSYGRD